MHILNSSWHNRTFSIIFLLLPVTFITGSFLPDLFASLIGLYFLTISIKYRLIKYYKNFFFYIFFLFYFYLVFRGLLSEYPYESLIDYDGPIFYFRYLFFVLGIKYLLDFNKDLIKFFTISLLAVVLLTSFDGYIQWITGYNLLGFKPPTIRITGVFNNEEILGHFLAHTTPLLIALLAYVFGINKKKILIYMFILIFVEIMIFISGDRAAFLKIFQFTFLLIILSKNFKLIRLISFIISALIILLLIMKSPNSTERYELTVQEISSTTIPYMPWSQVHESHYAITLDMFSKNPIFGQGPQLFRTLCHITPKYSDGCASHPHNYYMQTLGELGAIGVSFLLFFFLNISYILYRQFISLWFSKNKKFLLSDHYLFLICLIFVILWPLIPHNSFYNNWLNPIIFTVIGFFVYFKKNKKDQFQI